jgi:hypothetical protein
LNLLIQIPVISKLIAKNISLPADREFINLVGLAVDVVSDLGSVSTMDALMLKFEIYLFEFIGKSMCDGS